MIKRTIYFGNPAYLSLKNKQLEVRQAQDDSPQRSVRTIPIEDIGVVLLDHQQITITHGLLNALQENNCAVITCSSNHMPSGLLLPLDGHTLQNERFRSQLEASLPLRKQLWQQTIQAKITNQAHLLAEVLGEPVPNMLAWAKLVKSGDTGNLEARAAAFYWRNLFITLPDFTREREEIAPNSLLNYGYAILRAIIARSLVGCGLLPTLGIHHHNKYNAYCLADDIMEPYRPFVDQLVVDLCNDGCPDTLTKEIKGELLSIPTLDVEIDGQRRPLMIAASFTLMKHHHRLNEYRIMWVFVLFDLPTYTPLERKAASGFRNELIKDGFTMFQYSVYIRHCSSAENAAVHIRRVKNMLPEEGEVVIMQVTDKQFGMIEHFSSHHPSSSPSPSTPVEMF